jgi:hypothetical protein
MTNVIPTETTRSMEALVATDRTSNGVANAAGFSTVNAAEIAIKTPKIQRVLLASTRRHHGR